MATPATRSGPWVRVIIVNYNAGTLLQACVAALAAQTLEDFEAVIVDNASTDGSADALLLPDARFSLLRNAENVGFAAANNIGAEGCEAPWLATLNPDTVAEPDWLQEMHLGTERHANVVMLGATLLSADDPSIVDGFGDVLSIAGIAWRFGSGSPAASLPPRDREVFSPCAAAALYRREAFERVGGFDPSFFCYLEDVDLAFRLRLTGERCIQLRNARVRHRISAISGELSAFTLFHSFRNRLWLLLKCMPLPLLLVSVPLNLVCSIFLIAKLAFDGAPPGAPLKGLLKGLSSGDIFRSRRQAQRDRRVSTAAVARSLVWNLYLRTPRAGA
jgi:N-acetylglucosaminyl-diphospho-decaprenol L-rhamnosyltransferase